MKHSISAERMWQRCPRQYFISEIMADTNAHDERRNYAQVLKNINTTDEWIGLVVHRAIEKWVVPKLKLGYWPSTNVVLRNAVDLAHQQFMFSANGRYEYVNKTNDDTYCILWQHFFEDHVDTNDLNEACEVIKQALLNLLNNQVIRSFIAGRKDYIVERMLWYKLDGINVSAKLDLYMPSQHMDGLDIIDWKVALHPSDYNYQVAVYGLAALHNSGNLIPYIHLAKLGVRGYIINLLDDDPASAIHNPYCIDEQALIRAENLMFERLQSIRTICGDKKYADLNAADFALANSEGSCTLCTLQKLCLEIDNDRTPQPLPSLKSEPTQLALPFNENW